MGNIDSLRDWGHAKDYVRMQWMMLQQDEPEDFVIATVLNTQFESLFMGGFGTGSDRVRRLWC